MQRLVRHAPIVALLLAVLAAIVVPRLKLSGDLARLFPDDPPARALGAYVRAFGGGDVTIVLVKGSDPEAVASAAEDFARSVQGRPGILRATTTLAPTIDPDAPPPDPTIAWAFADDEGRKELARALSDEGMRARLEETRALLMAPGASGMQAFVRHDPLRLLAVIRGRARSVAATVGADESGALTADQGRARFVLVTTQGSALRSEEARRVVEALEATIAEVLPRHPGITAAIAGGAAIARDAERMIRRDLYISSAVSTILVALAFVVAFRRPRALLAIGPPLLIGTLWTAALAALYPEGIAAIAMGFASVVIGVGLDTGVHVYAAVQRARLAGEEDVAAAARREVGRPTLTAAFAAAFAFGSLALSRLPALRQLGVLCALGEVLTAIAILALTPPIAARLEKKGIERTPMRALEPIARVATQRQGAIAVSAAVIACVVALAIVGAPRPAPALVAVKPRGLPSLVAQEEAIRLASGASASFDLEARPTAGGEVQLVITQKGDARDEAALLARGEALARSIAVPGRHVESLTHWLPSPVALAARIAERDRLDLPARADALQKALAAEGFAVDDPTVFAPALDHFKKPAPLDTYLAAARALREGAFAPLVARHLARDPEDSALILATYVRARDLDANVLAAEVAKIDSQAVVTGYPVLESSLRKALSADLPRVAIAALVLVVIALRTVLRGYKEVLVALFALGAELVVVALVVRLAHVPLHVYDALVLPVLIGITVDESMFLLHAMRHGDPREALQREGRAIVSTALTTAAGFAALLGCSFPGLRDLGAIGLIGTLAGLLASLFVVPAAARLLGLGQDASSP